MSTRVDTETARQQAGPVLEPAYLDIMERYEQRLAGAPPRSSDDGSAPELTLEEHYRQARELLAGGTGDEADEAAAGRPLPVDVERLAGPLRHEARVDQLTASDESRFQQLVASGEQSLRDGEYFWAERRFERALRFTPGHPLATAGKGHAQIGAGLYAPAALTLHRLLTQRPEMIDVRFGQELLPSRVRLDLAVDRLQQLMLEQRDRDLHAFLLAYLGHQLERPDLIEKGLATMGEASPDDPLLELLRVVWSVE